MRHIGNKGGDEYFASGSVQEEIMQGNYIELIAAVVRLGLKQEGREYVRTCGGQYWCGLGGLDPEVVWAKTALLAERRPQPREAAASSKL